MLQPDAFCEHNAAKCDSGRDFVPESPGIRTLSRRVPGSAAPESPGIRTLSRRVPGSAFCPGESRDPLPRRVPGSAAPESPGIRCPGESRDPHFVPESPGIRCPGESRDPLPRPRLLYNTLEMAITLQPSDAIFGYSGREKGRKRSEGKGRGRQRGLSGRWRGLGRR